MPTPEQIQPNACTPHATSMQNAGTLQEQAQEARARIPRIPRARHTPEVAGSTELTNAGVTVDDERPAVVPWRPEVSVARHLRDSGYTFFRESMAVLE